MFQTNRNVYWTTATYQGQFAEDHITFRSMASSDGKLRVPTAGFGQTGSRGCYYNWFISVDGGNYTQYVGTGSTSNNIIVAEGLDANSEHIVDIRIFEIEDAYGRARAFGWYGSGIADRLLEIIVDSTYLGFANSAQDTGNYFRYCQYRDCINLRNAYNEFIPATCRDTGTYFRCNQYQNCRSLTVAGVESCPNSITEIKGGFREYQYAGCTNLAQPAAEVMPNTVTSIGDHFRGWEYQNCTSITNGAQEVMPPNLERIYSYFRCNQYEGCTNLTTLSDEEIPDTVTHIYTYFRLCQYRNCPNIIRTAREALPSSLTYLEWHYRHQQYEGDTGITEVTGMYAYTSNSNTYCRYLQFNGAFNTTTPATIRVIGKPVVEASGGGNPGMNNSRIATVYVPVELLQGYKNSGNELWRGINDNKFIGY